MASEEKDDLLLELQAVAPTQVAATPRFWSNLRDEFARRCAYDVPGAPDSPGAHEIRSTRARAEVIALLGHRLRGVTTGGARTDAVTAEFLRATFTGTLISESYGALCMSLLCTSIVA